MLHIIAGRAKTGKTGKVRAMAAASARDGVKTILIVPEQASFINERALEQMMSAGQNRTMVYSFSRFADMVLKALGGSGKVPESKAAQAFLMASALSETADQLKMYHRERIGTGFIAQLLALIEEWRNAGIKPEQLSVFALSKTDGVLRDKLVELSLVYDCFEALLQKSGISEQDILSLAAEKLYESDFLQDTNVFVDDFSSFTAPQQQMLAVMMNRAKSLTVSVCGGVDEKSPALLLGSDTAARLLREAAKSGTEQETTVLEHSYITSSALRSMETAVREESAPPPCENDGAVTSLHCLDPYDELERVAAKIAYLVREKGFRYRDIAVVARDLKRYRAHISPVFERYELPFFLDLQKNAASCVLTFGFLSLVSAACEDFSADYLLVASSPVFGVEGLIRAELENYAYVWSLRFKDWEKPFDKNPNGMSGEMSEKDKELLKRLEETRARLVEPVLLLRSAVKSGDGTKIAQAIWGVLENAGIAEKLNTFALSLPENKRDGFLQEQSLLYRQLLGVLELFEALSGEIELPKERVLELIRLSIAAFEVASVPQRLDEITIGTAERMREENIKVLFMIGAVEGEFPSSAAPGGLLSAGERKLLAQSDFSLFTDADRSQITEKMFCYRAVTMPCELMFVSYPAFDSVGAQLSPSFLFSCAAALTGEKQDTVLDEVWTRRSLERRAAAAAVKDFENEKVIKRLFAETFGEDELKRLEAVKEKKTHKISSAETARSLFGQRIKLSPSRLESFYSCHFTYYMQRGLGAKKLRRAELSPAQAGVLIHRVLENIVKRYGKELSLAEPEQLKSEIQAETVGYLTECLGELESAPRRLVSNFERLGTKIFDMLQNLAEELAQSEFMPEAFEVHIGDKGEIEPLVLKGRGGAEISVEGVVDRVDTAVIDGKKYVRIIDYKSGKKTFELSKTCYGLDLQMLIYLCSIVKNQRGELKSLLPAGALYVPALGGYISGRRDMSEWELGRLKQSQFSMSGLLLNDEQVLKAMEKNLEGLYLPYGGKKSGSVYSEGEFDKLFSLVEEKLCDMVDSLHEGLIEALPAQSGNSLPCEYCEFRRACGFEENDPVRPILKLSEDKIFGKEKGDENKMDL